jgi:hypothetical protein
MLYSIKDYWIMIDDEDYDKVYEVRWTPRKTNKYVYFSNASSGKCFYLHRVIMNCPKGLVVDHINGDTLDNRKANLRNCTNRENLQNTHKIRKIKTRETVIGNNGLEYPYKYTYRGVYKDKIAGKWQVQISAKGKRYFLGSYKDIKMAAIIYIRAASLLRYEEEVYSDDLIEYLERKHNYSVNY